MKKKYILALVPFLLAGCSKTNNLYGAMDYNYNDIKLFDNNYYTDWNGIDKVSIRSQIPGFVMSDVTSQDGLTEEYKNKYTWADYKLDTDPPFFGQSFCLGNVDESFKDTGILSKLFDGRVRCDGKNQTKLRVQLAKNGFAMYFPKILVECEEIAFACRGATTCENPLELGPAPGVGLAFNFELSFYIHIENSEQYDKLTYNLVNIPVQCDNHGNTNLVSFKIPKLALENCVAMSFKWDSNDSRLATYNLADVSEDPQKEKNHLALMLYEFFLLNSKWY